MRVSSRVSATQVPWILDGTVPTGHVHRHMRGGMHVHKQRQERAMLRRETGPSFRWHGLRKPSQATIGFTWIALASARTSFNEKRNAGVSSGQSSLHIMAIAHYGHCTLWPVRFHQECLTFSLMQPACPDIPSFAHFDDCCFTSNFFFQSDATHMSRWLPSDRRWFYPPIAAGYPPTAVAYPPTAVGYPPHLSAKKKSCPLKNDPASARQHPSHKNKINSKT